MMALLRSDLHRILRSRWPWAVLGIVALATLGSAILTIWWPLEPGVVYDGLTGRAGALHLAGRGSSISLVSTIAPFVAAHLSCADSDAGFDRTLLSSLHGRAAYYAEKYLLAALLSGALLVAYLAFGGLGVLVTMRPVETVEPLWQVVAWAGEGWLISCVYALAVLLVGQLVRSRAIAFIAAFLLTSAAVEQESLSHVEPFVEVEPSVHGRAREQPPRRGSQPAVERLEERVRCHETSRREVASVPAPASTAQSGTQTARARKAGERPVASTASMSAAPLPTETSTA